MWPITASKFTLANYRITTLNFRPTLAASRSGAMWCELTLDMEMKDELRCEKS